MRDPLFTQGQSRPLDEMMNSPEVLLLFEELLGDRAEDPVRPYNNLLELCALLQARQQAGRYARNASKG